MGEQGGLRTGWLAAFGTEGYDGEPPLLEELGVNFGHIRDKVCLPSLNLQPMPQLYPYERKDSESPKQRYREPASFSGLWR